jgi:hypothetical protein
MSVCPPKQSASLIFGLHKGTSWDRVVRYESKSHVNPCSSRRNMGKWRYIHLLLTLALDGDDWLASRRDRFTHRISALGTHCTYSRLPEPARVLCRRGKSHSFAGNETTNGRMSSP